MRFVAVIPVLFAIVMAASAQTPLAPSGYPTRPMRIIVPFSAGSASDILARTLAQKMTENWGQQVVVDNRPSAAGTVAGEIVARGTPDGYTLLVTSSAIAGSAALYPKLPYDTVKDFAPISMIAVAPVMFIAAPNAGIKTMKDLIEAAKAKPAHLTYGHSGIGSGTHYAGELFNVAAGIKTVHVPYKGAAEVLTDAATLRLNYAIVPMAPAVPLVKGGRVFGIAVTTATRSHTLPDVPTVAESGLPGYRYDGWFGMFAPGKLPLPLVNQLGAEVARILALPDVRDRILNLATTPKSSTPAELHQLLKSEITTRRKIFKDVERSAADESDKSSTTRARAASWFEHLFNADYDATPAPISLIRCRASADRLQESSVSSPEQSRLAGARPGPVFVQGADQRPCVPGLSRHARRRL